MTFRSDCPACSPGPCNCDDRSLTHQEREDYRLYDPPPGDNPPTEPGSATPPASQLGQKMPASKAPVSPKYSKLQILEAMQQVVSRVEAETSPASGQLRSTAECLLSDIFALLEGDPRWAVARQVIVTPQFGFVPVLGTVNGDGSISWFGYGDDDDDAAAMPEVA